MAVSGTEPSQQITTARNCDSVTCLLSHTDTITTTGVIGTGTDNKELRSRTTACTLTSRALLLAFIFHLDPRIHRAKEVVQVGRPKVSPVARVMEIVPRRLVRIR